MSSSIPFPSTNGGDLAGDETPTLSAQKAVTIFEEPEHIPNERLYASSPQRSPKLHRASISGKKMTGRPPPIPLTSSPTLGRAISPSMSRNVSYLKLEDSAQLSETGSPVDAAGGRDELRKLFAQVTEWLNDEKAKRGMKSYEPQLTRHDSSYSSKSSRHSDADQDFALDKLEKILHNFAFGTSMGPLADSRPKKSRSMGSFRRGSIARAYKRSHISHHGASSDTEWVGEDINVPHVEAELDNSRTMAFAGCTDIEDVEAAQQRDLKHWEQFKRDIVRLAHTLKIRGWRRIPIEKGEAIIVERLSGALTNAVYVVKPPEQIPESDHVSATKPHMSKSRPVDLLLRIYGPQVEHLIDREVELGVLRRLARQKIGPRLLGYFTNGRFEEFFHAKTLKAEDLRVPETMKQIAKRMRELHDGIELLPTERHAGPQVFKNWDFWYTRLEKVITWLDAQVKQEAAGQEPASKRYTRRGFICGVEWPVFKKAYNNYRKWLSAECGGHKAIQRRLVFAHNDTQYGNLMRLNPPGASPLMKPANQHRQLVVIDFEYAGANVPGFEFANHFSEWGYDYHAEPSFEFNPNKYPTREQQYTFIRSYVTHRPQYHYAASATPKMEPKEKKIVPDFMLDTEPYPGHPGGNYDEEEKAREEMVETDVQMLLHETKLWRTANAAWWVAWGIVQAKIPELDDPPKKSKAARVAAALEHVKEHLHPRSDPIDKDVELAKLSSKQDRPEARDIEEAHAEGSDSGGDDIEEFDYLAYAQQRAMFFWGDCLQMGIVKRSDLPKSLLDRVITRYTCVGHVKRLQRSNRA